MLMYHLEIMILQKIQINWYIIHQSAMIDALTVQKLK